MSAEILSDRALHTTLYQTNLLQFLGVDDHHADVPRLLDFRGESVLFGVFGKSFFKVYNVVFLVTHRRHVHRFVLCVERLVHLWWGMMASILTFLSGKFIRMSVKGARRKLRQNVLI